MKIFLKTAVSALYLCFLLQNTYATDNHLYSDFQVSTTCHNQFHILEPLQSISIDNTTSLHVSSSPNLFVPLLSSPDLTYWSEDPTIDPTDHSIREDVFLSSNEYDINDFKSNQLSPRVVDIFCGAGGTSEGFRQAGFNIICGIDNNECSIKTFKANFPQASAIKKDIYDLDPTQLLELLGIQPNELEVLLASPSCKNFSYLNGSPKKNSLDALQYEPLLRIIQVLGPKCIF